MRRNRHAKMRAVCAARSGSPNRLSTQGVIRQMDRRGKVLITGGAGFLGINLARHLLSRGYEVASLDLEPFDYPERGRVEELTGDIRDKAFVDRAVEGADFVVHTAAALPPYSAADIYTTDVAGTRTAPDAPLRHGA